MWGQILSGIQKNREAKSSAGPAIRQGPVLAVIAVGFIAIIAMR